MNQNIFSQILMLEMLDNDNFKLCMNKVIYICLPYMVIQPLSIPSIVQYEKFPKH